MRIRTTIDKLTKTILESGELSVISGAGLSTKAGIPDYVQLDKSWPYDVPRSTATSIGFLKKNPSEFWNIYKDIFLNDAFRKARHTKGHDYLVWLEKQGVNVNIFTQNVDGLHQAAGSSHVVELHGNTKGAECFARKHYYATDEIIDENGVVNYRCPIDNSILNPTVVLFGEVSDGYKQVKKHFDQNSHKKSVVLFMGTSLRVYPVAAWPADLSRLPEVTNVLWDAGAIRNTQIKYFDFWLNENFSDINPEFL